MKELDELQRHCEEIEKIVHDIRCEVIGLNNNALDDLVGGLDDGVVEMGRVVDEVKNKIIGE